MAVFEALQTALGALRRNPVIALVTAGFALFQVPGLLAQNIHPLVASLLSLVVSGLTIFVTPFFMAGIIGMADEAIDGATTLSTFVDEGKRNYLQMFLVYLLLLVVNFVLGFVGFGVVIFGGLAIVGSGLATNTLALALGGLFLVALFAAYLSVAFFTQFYGQAIVIDDLDAVESLRHSIGLVRSHLVAVLGYTVIVGVGGGVFGAFGVVFSILTSPEVQNGGADAIVSQLPYSIEVPTIGTVEILGFAGLFVILASAFGGLFATFSVAFYRRLHRAA
jgi:hypothetical protein